MKKGCFLVCIVQKIGEKNMIWTLKVKIGECIRFVEIDSKDSFLSLHVAIQEAVDFDNDHLFEFFIGRHPGNRALSVGEEPNWDTFDPFDVYDRVCLEDV
jgi:Plasmid pRiA4b ORF-3-like protein